jgi:hypothetical protein
MSAKTYPYRYQEARAHRLRWTSHHLTGRQPSVVQPSPWHRLGVRSCLHRRCLAGRFHARSCPTSAKRVLSSSLRRRWLFRRAGYPHRAHEATAPATGQRLSGQPANASASARYSPSPILPANRQTASGPPGENAPPGTVGLRPPSVSLPAPQPAQAPSPPPSARHSCARTASPTRCNSRAAVSPGLHDQ